jgi:phage terminase small subunit
MLAKVSIKAAVDKLIAEVEEKSKLSVAYVLEGLQRVTERCQTVVPVMEKVDGKWEETGEFKFDSSGANKSLELIGKHLKMFTDKVEHSGNFTVVLRDYSKEANQ